MYVLISLTGVFSVGAFWDWLRNSVEVRKAYTSLVLWAAVVNVAGVAFVTNALQGSAVDVSAPLVLAALFACVRVAQLAITVYDKLEYLLYTMLLSNYVAYLYLGSVMSGTTQLWSQMRTAPSPLYPTVLATAAYTCFLVFYETAFIEFQTRTPSLKHRTIHTRSVALYATLLLGVVLTCVVLHTTCVALAFSTGYLSVGGVHSATLACLVAFFVLYALRYYSPTVDAARWTAVAFFLLKPAIMLTSSLAYATAIPGVGLLVSRQLNILTSVTWWLELGVVIIDFCVTQIRVSLSDP